MQETWVWSLGQEDSLRKGMAQFSSAQLCLTFCDPMDGSMLGLPGHHQLLEVAQTHVHQVGDAIQPSHPLSSSSPPTFNLFPSIFSPFSSHLQSGSFPVGQLFASGGQSIGASASAPVLPMNVPDWFPLVFIGWISLQSKGLSRVFSNTTVPKASTSQCSAFFMVQLSHTYMTTGKTITLTRWTFFGKVMSLLFNMLSRMVIAFLPRSVF